MHDHSHSTGPSDGSLLDFLGRVFDADFVPRGECVSWRPEIVWLHVASDAAIMLAYYSIPLALIYFVRRRRDLAFNWMFVMFAAFILACGTTHFMSIIAFWKPLYRLDGLIKLATGAISLVTAVMLWQLLPKAIALPSPAQLRVANEELKREIGVRERAEASLQHARADLERRVHERTAELRQSEERFRVALAGAPITVFNQDRELRYTWVHNPLPGMTVGAILGRRDADIFAAPDAARFEAFKRAVLDSGTGNSAELPIAAGDDSHFFDLRVEPLRDGAGTITGVTCVAVDITERKRQEEHRDFLLAELDHRVKNNLSTVLSLAEESFNTAQSKEDFSRAFIGRVRALARTHTALAATSWKGIRMEDLVRLTLDAYTIGDPARIDAAGDRFVLSPKTGAVLCMTLNELATNAVKYGALSVPPGAITLRWTCTPGSGPEAMIHLTWIERGGPPVHPPTRLGLGTDLIKNGVAYELGGTVEMEYPLEGLRCVIDFPLDVSGQRHHSGPRPDVCPQENPR